MTRLLVLYVISTNFGRNMAGNFRNISLLIVCYVQINSSIAFFLLDKSSMVNDVPENDNFCLNPVSSWRCGLWSPHRSPYSLQVSPWTKLLFSDPRNLVGRPIYMAIFVCRSSSRFSMLCGADHQYPIVSVTLL